MGVSSRLLALLVAGAVPSAFGCEFDLVELGKSVLSQRTTCRANRPPHQADLWHEGFPASNLPAALCEGSVQVQPDGTICVTGRVTYEQIAQAVGRPIFSPAARSISINGHLITGSANVVLGPYTRYLYDFVKTYTIADVEYSADSAMIDNLLAASRGAVDAVCLDASFAPYGPAGYTISSKRWNPSEVDAQEFSGANLAFISSHSIVAEFHAPADPWEGWNSLYGMFERPPLLGGSTWSEALGMTVFNGVSSIPLPTFVISSLPGFLGLVGLLRLYLVQGTFSLEEHPLPLVAPPAAVEGIEVDTEWSTLMAAIDAGLFSSPSLPSELAIVLKRVSPSENTVGCWTEPAAAIDIQAPVGSAAILDEYVDSVLYPSLATYGTVGLHFGKRVPSGSMVLNATLEKYARCGAALALNGGECIHPMCRRTTVPSPFNYPSKYYA
eukprot:scaffold263608_cov37-Tisochrysis_lutea.AAC.1